MGQGLLDVVKILVVDELLGREIAIESSDDQGAYPDDDDLNIEIEEGRAKEATNYLSEKRIQIDTDMDKLIKERDKIIDKFIKEYAYCEKMRATVSKLTIELREMAIETPSEEINTAIGFLESYGFTIFRR